MSAGRDPAPVATPASLTMTQRGDLDEALRAAGNKLWVRQAVINAFLRGVASERDASRGDQRRPPFGDGKPYF